MAKKGRVQVKLRSSESAYMYVTTKNPKKHPERMELRKYDPVADARGGFPTKWGKLTKPGGHFKEISDLQGGLKKDLTSYTKNCAGSGVQVSRDVDIAANAPVAPPPGLP